MGLKVRQRQLLQVREEVVPHVVLNLAGCADDDAAHEKPGHAADKAGGQQEPAVEDQFRARHVASKIVDRVLEHLRRREQHDLRDDDASESEDERATVSQRVGEQAAKRRHLGKYNRAFRPREPREEHRWSGVRADGRANDCEIDERGGGQDR